jgi:uncharacterized LabA/DUF88 family protein
MLVTSLIAIIILLVCVALLSVGVLFKKDGTFPDTHIESSKALREKGIHCAVSQDYEQQNRKNLDERINE